MIKLFLVSFALAGAALLGLGGLRLAHAADDGCAADYYAVEASLARTRESHVSWIEYLEWAGPSYVPPGDVGSLQAQRDFLVLYDWRMWTVYHIATGDRGEAFDLLRNFSDSAELHRTWARQGGASGSPAFHAAAADEYDWRIATVQRLIIEC